MRGVDEVNRLGGICPAASFEKSMTTGWPGPALAPQPQNSSIRPLGRSNDPSPMPPVLSLGIDLPGSGASSGSDLRSEEHTSELQSLMRISYAVFCLTKKKKK